MKNSKKTKLTEKELNMFKEAKKVLHLGVLYGLLDGTLCSSRDQAITTNNDIRQNYSYGH